MIDFTSYTTLQVIRFVETHPTLFAHELCEDFPKNIIRQLNGDIFQSITRREGFAFVSRELNEMDDIFPGKNAELMFLYVQPEFEGTGIGADLIAKAKACLPDGRIMEFACEGEKRFRNFERKGFKLMRYDEENDLYHLEWSPSK